MYSSFLESFLQNNFKKNSISLILNQYHQHHNQHHEVHLERRIQGEDSSCRRTKGRIQGVLHSLEGYKKDQGARRIQGGHQEDTRRRKRKTVWRPFTSHSLPLSLNILPPCCKYTHPLPNTLQPDSIHLPTLITAFLTFALIAHHSSSAHSTQVCKKIGWLLCASRQSFLTGLLHMGRVFTQ